MSVAAGRAISRTPTLARSMLRGLAMKGHFAGLAALTALLTVVGCSSGSTPAAASAGSKCAAAPTQLLTANDLFGPDATAIGISAGMDLAVNATDLYVAVNYGSSGGAILRAPIRGGAPAVVASVDGSEQGFMLTADSVVFAQADNPYNHATGAIVRVGLQGGSRTVLASASIEAGTIFGPSGILATDGTDVYFAASDGTRAVPLAGGAARMLTSHTGPLTIVGTNLVIADSAAEGVFTVPLAGGDPAAIASNLSGNLGPILGCGSNICWASAVPVSPSEPGTGQLMQLAPAGGTPVSLAASDDLYVVNHLAFDGTAFYATMLADVSFGVLARVPAAGGAPMMAAGGDGLAIDDECLYVGDVTHGVYSVAKAQWASAP